MIVADGDFETRSRCELKLAGAEAYSEHPTTEVVCLVVHVSDGRKVIWWPGQPADELATLAADPEVHWVAHNAAFEQAIWRNQMVARHGFAPIEVKRWSCTLAAAAHKSLPLAQEKLVRALELSAEKDMDGRKLTLSLSKPITKKAWMDLFPGAGSKKDWAALWPKDTLPEITDEIRQRVIAYCDRDVEGEVQVRCKIGLLRSYERGIWDLDQAINQRGVRIDLDYVMAAQRVVQKATLTLNQEFQAITDGIGPGQVAKIKEWCSSNGVDLDNLQKATLEALLDSEPEDADVAAGIITNAAEDDYEQDTIGEQSDPRPMWPERLPPLVKRVLEIRQLLGSASIKKLSRMRACVSSDGRARGLLQYHAAHPGRWGGRLFQPQNFPRGVAVKYGNGSTAEQEHIIDAIMTGDPGECSQFCERMVDGSLRPIHPIELVSGHLRHALVPDPGKLFLVGDYAGIEMRIVLAMAGQGDKLDLITSGADVYLDMAEDIYGQEKGAWAVSDRELLKKIKEERVGERTIGKNTVLGCGFQMGGQTFHSRYCSHMEEEFAHDVVATYRKVWAPKVPPLWYSLGDAALETCQYERPHEAYGVEYELQDGFLCARLPSGWQTVWYPNPAVEWDNRFEKYCWSYSTWQNGQERRKRAYGGLLTENAVQALARGLLVGSMRRVEAAGMPVVLTVHDEIVAEVDECSADLKMFERVMAETSPWAQQMKIPVAVEGWVGYRYRK